MKSRRLLYLSSLTIGTAFALSAGASQFSVSSRVTLGPSLNKDISSTAPSNPAAPSRPAPAASNVAPLAQPIMQPTAQPTPQPAAVTQPTTVIVQPERPPNAMERAGQLVRSVLRKIDPKPLVVTPRDSVDLTRARTGTGLSVNTAAPITIPPNSALTAASATNADSSKETRQLQRGIMNEQKMNVGMIQYQ